MMYKESEVFEYHVWKCNRFDQELLEEKVAEFANEELALDFVSYQASLGNNYVVQHNGEVLQML